MAHELAHIKNCDTTIMVVAAAIPTLATFPIFLGKQRQGGIWVIGLITMVVLAPLAASLIQMAIIRFTEDEAHRVGAENCGNPRWLAFALKSIQDFEIKIDNQKAKTSPYTEHIFIVYPFPK